MPRNLIHICQVLRSVLISHLNFDDIRYSLGEKKKNLLFIYKDPYSQGEIK